MTVKPLIERLGEPQFDPLTKEREQELGRQLIDALETNDEQALYAIREELANRHLRLVLHIGQQYRLRLDVDEILAVGALALTQAASRWHPHRGQMYPWAERWITTALTRATDANRTIRIPQKVMYKTAVGEKAVRDRANALGRDLTPEEVEKLYGDAKPYAELPQVVASLDYIIEGPVKGSPVTLAELLPDDEDGPHEKAEVALTAQAVLDALSELTALEQEVIRHRFALAGAQRLTLSELGGRHAVTGEAMRRVEACALAKLRHPAVRTQLEAEL